MKPILVTESAVRALIREAFDARPLSRGEGKKANNKPPVSVNDVVDPSAAVTDPENEKFVPTNSTEFMVAIKDKTADLPDEKFHDLYKQVTGVITDLEKEKDASSLVTKGEKRMKNRNRTEAIIRAHVRKMISESGLYAARAARRKESGDGPSVVDKEAGEKSLHEIAEELGYSQAGARAVVERALEKAAWIASVDLASPDALEGMVLVGVDNYIEELKSSGVLSAADVKLLKDHPKIVAELDGFREFMDLYFKRAIRSNPAGGNIKKGDIAWPESGQVSGPSPRAIR